MHQCIESGLVQIWACRLFGGKPFSKPMLGYCRLNLKEESSVTFNQSTKLFTHDNTSENNVCEMLAILSNGDELTCSVIWGNARFYQTTKNKMVTNPVFVDIIKSKLWGSWFVLSILNCSKKCACLRQGQIHALQVTTSVSRYVVNFFSKGLHGFFCTGNLINSVFLWFCEKRNTLVFTQFELQNWRRTIGCCKLYPLWVLFL